MKDSLKEDIFNLYERAVASAAEKSLQTVATWADLQYHTYKAICRHDGRYRNSRASHNFNFDLAEPIYNYIGTGWEKAFRASLPASFARFMNTAEMAITQFHEHTVEISRIRMSNPDDFAFLQQRLETSLEELRFSFEEVREKCAKTRRKSCREFEPVIKTAMMRAYMLCESESGRAIFLL